MGLLKLEDCSGWQFAWFAGERANGREMNIFVISPEFRRHCNVAQIHEIKCSI